VFSFCRRLYYLLHQGKKEEMHQTWYIGTLFVLEPLENNKQWFGERKNFARKRSHAISSKFAIGLLRKQIFLDSVEKGGKKKASTWNQTKERQRLRPWRWIRRGAWKNRGEESEGKRVQASARKRQCTHDSRLLAGGREEGGSTLTS
jgi:hypothetical protein